jgi:cytochrome bd-type quinol oxidase subunit 1
MIIGSLATIAVLYAALIVLDVWLMRRYARFEPEPRAETEDLPEPVLGF